MTLGWGVLSKMLQSHNLYLLVLTCVRSFLMNKLSAPDSEDLRLWGMDGAWVQRISYLMACHWWLVNFGSVLGRFQIYLGLECNYWNLGECLCFLGVL